MSADPSFFQVVYKGTKVRQLLQRDPPTPIVVEGNASPRVTVQGVAFILHGESTCIAAYVGIPRT